MNVRNRRNGRRLDDWRNISSLARLAWNHASSPSSSNLIDRCKGRLPVTFLRKMRCLMWSKTMQLNDGGSARAHKSPRLALQVPSIDRGKSIPNREDFITFSGPTSQRLHFFDGCVDSQHGQRHDSKQVDDCSLTVLDAP
jgi:hypothetical protein